MKSIPTKQAAPKVGTPKPWTVHHPSCRESDRDLVWHCSQCGLNESAAELEAAAQELAETKAQRDELLAALKQCAHALDGPLLRHGRASQAHVNAWKEARAAIAKATGGQP